jgi:hypothetical protein
MFPGSMCAREVGIEERAEGGTRQHRREVLEHPIDLLAQPLEGMTCGAGSALFTLCGQLGGDVGHDLILHLREAPMASLAKG